MPPPLIVLAQLTPEEFAAHAAQGGTSALVYVLALSAAVMAIALVWCVRQLLTRGDAATEARVNEAKALASTAARMEGASEKLVEVVEVAAEHAEAMDRSRESHDRSREAFERANERTSTERGGR